MIPEGENTWLLNPLRGLEQTSDFATITPFCQYLQPKDFQKISPYLHDCSWRQNFLWAAPTCCTHLLPFASSKCPPGRTAQPAGTTKLTWWGRRGSRPVLLVPTIPVRLVCWLPTLGMKRDNQLKYYFAKTTLKEILELLTNVFFNCLGTSLVTEMVKNLPSKQET